MYYFASGVVQTTKWNRSGRGLQILEDARFFLRLVDFTGERRAHLQWERIKNSEMIVIVV